MARDFFLLLYRHQITAVLLLFAVLLTLGGISKAADLMYRLDRGVPVPGLVERVEERQSSEPTGKPKYVPVISYTSPSGDRRVFQGTPADKPRFEAGKTVSLLYDPANPEAPLIKLPLFELGLEPLVLMIISCLFTALAAFIAFRPRDFAALFRDRTFDEQRFAPTSGLLAGVPYIKQGRYPLELCELTAYMAALAYEKPADIDSHFKNHCPHYTHFFPFSKADTEGFGFVHDGVAYIIMRGTMGWGDWARNLKAWYTKPDEKLPAGWTGPQRHFGFAEGWDVVRDQVETWVKSTPYADDPKMPFVFAGHSLGGALSFLGAWEFARRERNVAAVITFGAARPGAADFAEDYERLGLEDRTLRLEFDKDIVPTVQGLVGYANVGHGWIPEKAPLLSEKSAAAAILLSWLVAALGTNLFGKDVEQKADAKEAATRTAAPPLPDGTVVAATSSTPAPATTTQTVKKFVRNNWREIAVRLVLLAAFSGILALAAHKMQRRYALALTTMSYNRLRSRLAATLAETGTVMKQEEFLENAYEALEHHLREVRGSTPNEPGPFRDLKNLPNRIASPRDLEWLNTFHAARIW